MKIKTWFFISLSCLVLIGGFVYLVLDGSRPKLSGTVRLQGLLQRTIILKDRYGIPTIKGNSRLDIARATGFLHAQERFFQMDLMRRRAAGELSEIFGEATIELDKKQRMHGFRRQARFILPTLTGIEQEILASYTEGVNEGLKALKCKPFEYYILREKPAVWKEEDSLLVGLGLFFDLQDSEGMIDLVRGVLRRTLPDLVYQFLVRNSSTWDAPLDNSSLKRLPIPSREDFQYLHLAQGSFLLNKESAELPIPARGSNQWAVDASCTEKKQAMLACDMHLNLLAPNIWYRLGISYKEGTGKQIRVDGITLPGTPFIAAGSNRSIAWGFTNAYIDTTDLILLEIDPNNPMNYCTDEGFVSLEEVEEEIRVKGSSPIRHTVFWTKWGPLHPEKFFGAQMAVRWIAHDIDCFNFRLLDLETVSSSEEALKILPEIRLPVLNFMVADQKGHIGWGYVGAIPLRGTYEPGLPVGWKEWGNWTRNRVSTEYPSLLDPVSGRLWTANNRVLLDSTLGQDYLNPIRAYQIQKRLFSSDSMTVCDMYELQLDDEAVFFNRWNELFKKTLDLTCPRHQELFSIISNWDHHCSSSSQGYFWIRAFREKVKQKIVSRLLAPCFQEKPDLNYNLLDLEEPIYLIASKQPSYLANTTWEIDLFEMIEEILDENESALKEKKTWGDFNIALIRHPLSYSLSWFSSLLDMPKQALSGDYYVPRVSSSFVGASVRMVVSPGNEEEGVFNMPCGQSGHPLSKHYRDQQNAWVEGKSTPFLPGPPIHELCLVP